MPMFSPVVFFRINNDVMKSLICKNEKKKNNNNRGTRKQREKKKN